jgi:hypothetical protein
VLYSLGLSCDLMSSNKNIATKVPQASSSYLLLGIMKEGAPFNGRPQLFEQKSLHRPVVQGLAL